jgi:hypothetical protein
LLHVVIGAKYFRTLSNISSFTCYNKHYSSISYLNVLLYLEVLETYRQQCIFLLKKRIFLLKIVEICKLSQNHINISDKGTKFSNKDKQITVKHVLCDLPREHWNMVVTKYRVLINWYLKFTQRKTCLILLYHMVI